MLFQDTRDCSSTTLQLDHLSMRAEKCPFIFEVRFNPFVVLCLVRRVDLQRVLGLVEVGEHHLRKTCVF